MGQAPGEVILLEAVEATTHASPRRTNRRRPWDDRNGVIWFANGVHKVVFQSAEQERRAWREARTMSKTKRMLVAIADGCVSRESAKYFF